MRAPLGPGEAPPSHTWRGLVVVITVGCRAGVDGYLLLGQRESTFRASPAAGGSCASVRSLGQHRGDECNERRSALRQRPADTLAAGATERHPIGDEEHDAGQDHEQAGIDHQRPTDLIVAGNPEDHARNRSAAEEEVVEADVERPEPYGRDVGRRDCEDPAVDAGTVKEQNLPGKCEQVDGGADQRKDPHDPGHRTISGLSKGRS